jgi:hypothetical protein
MKSPFPGMDPYLETRWGDVHTSLCAYVRELLQPKLPPGLRARAEERVLFEDEAEEADDLGSYRPDAIVTEVRPAQASVGRAAVATVEPLVIERSADPPVDRWVQIIDTSNGNKVITVIEFLSPWNKVAGRLNSDYRAKVRDYLKSDVNFVEVDLLRGRRHRLAITHDDVPRDRQAEYVVCVNRGADRRRWEVYPLPLREKLPVVAIPLRSSDGDVGLDMQALVDRIYEAGGHDDIDYRKPLDPPLKPEDAAWLAQRL